MSVREGIGGSPVVYFLNYFDILQLWEMACARNIGISRLPIVCVNVNGYYEPFRAMLNRAWDDKLTKLKPDEIVHFASTAQEAVEWVEYVQSREHPAVELQKRQRVFPRNESVLGSPVTEESYKSILRRSIHSFHHSFSTMTDWAEENREIISRWAFSAALFVAGLSSGFLLSNRTGSR